MKANIKHAMWGMFLSLGLYSCTEKPQDAPKDEPFCLSDTMQSKVELTPAETKIVENELVLQGKVTFDEDKVAKVYPLVGGFVHELKANLGDFVKKGQVLAVIRSPEIASFANQTAVAQANLKVAEKNYQVATELYKTGTVSEVELVNAKKELENAQAELFRSKEVMSMYNVGNESYYNILSPASGFVVAKDVSLNMELRTEDVKPIFTISNLDNVWVMANVYESDISKIREGYKASITTMSYPDKVYKAKVDKLLNVIDPESKVLKAKIVLPNEGYFLKPEMFANVVVSFEDTEKRLAIPSKAVIFDKNKHWVMVYKDKCSFETREIDIYKAMPTYTYLNGGVAEGEKVISKYHMLVYDALND